ncbi:acyl-CoA-binding domain-containing protein 4 isoform X2 [Punica granatum]|uniref:Acyl-CoA-binding domain-containing protein 4 isoform X2 n=1 Tax=Punica granatum TaxID=22663 RepID=A0A6P8C9G2_PUNGR|nr:acyl-CoA-binding domain-containing protein 4 isoform X2 [Punica granatum]
MGTEEIRKDMDISSWCAELAYDQWVPLPVNGKPPSARYKHAAAAVDDKLYVIGGSRNGRYLSDVQVFDFKSLTWSSITLSFESNAGDDSKENLIATSGHVLWENKVLIVGGHSKSPLDSLQVRFINLDTHTSGFLETSGNIPVARGGHSATLIGSRLIIFGGEDRKRRLLNDIHILDLETMNWEMVEAMQTPPAPRFDHTSAVHGDRYLLVFGGCSHSIFYSDLHVLDLQTKEWSQPEIRGDLVTPRAGHAGVTIGENWYIVGGGDNKSVLVGCSETLVFNMSKLAWSTLSSVRERDPLASEGLSVCTTLIAGEVYLVAFGGYNGKYQNEIFFMKPKPRDSSRPKIFQSPAAAAAAACVTAAYALTKPDKLDLTESVDSAKFVENNVFQRDITAEVAAIKEEKNALEASLAKIREENSKQREKIDEANNTHSELSKELLSVQSQLVAERSRCFKLEAQIAELQKVLESFSSVENEVQALRSQKTALEQDMELASATRQGSGGFLGWLSGGPHSP